MGIYLNPGNEAFRQAVTDDIYIDKTGIISLMNQRLNKARGKYVCVSRSRRFGKSMAADMLATYYSRGCDARALFAGKKFESDPSYEGLLDRHYIIRLDIQQVLFQKSHLDVFIDKIQEKVIKELQEIFGNDFVADEYGLQGVLKQIYTATREGFIFIINKWDCVFCLAK